MPLVTDADSGDVDVRTPPAGGDRDRAERLIGERGLIFAAAGVVARFDVHWRTIP